MEIRLTFPTCAIIKKNSATTSYVYKDKHGRLRLRQNSNGGLAPITYYSAAYKDWAKLAVQQCLVYRSKHPELSFPLTGQFNLKCLFYYNRDGIVDLSNLYEGVQDVLAGNEKWLQLGVDWSIIKDDCTRFIGSHDGSRLILDYTNPRTEITLTPFKW